MVEDQDEIGDENGDENGDKDEDEDEDEDENGDENGDEDGAQVKCLLLIAECFDSKQISKLICVAVEQFVGKLSV